MKQTAVEWYSEKSMLLEIQRANGNISITQMLNELSNILDQSKEMEREQMIYIIKTYHNNLFYLPLSENGEADRILDLILTKQIKPKP
jgi:hypothetical protein